MIDVVVYTADMGGHDDDWGFPKQDMEAGFVKFNGPERAFELGCPQGLSDRLVSRWYKTHPETLFHDAAWSIWIDACLEITSHRFVGEVLAQTRTYSTFVHPDRHNVLDEADAAETLQKYDGNQHKLMLDQLMDTFGRVSGLHAMTVIARKHGDERVRRAEHMIWVETLAWSTHPATVLDQLILPFAAIETCLPINHFSGHGTLWDNDWFVRHPHRRDT